MATVTVEEMIAELNADISLELACMDLRKVTAARDYILAAESQLAERDAQIDSYERITYALMPCGHFESYLFDHGDRLYQNVELWKRELAEAGWKPHRKSVTIWESPQGALLSWTVRRMERDEAEEDRMKPPADRVLSYRPKEKAQKLRKKARKQKRKQGRK